MKQILKNINYYYPTIRLLSKVAKENNIKNHTLNVIKQLDYHKTENNNIHKPADQHKLIKSLIKKPKPILDVASQGSLDATSEDIKEHLNELLTTSKFMYVFEGYLNASDLIDFTKVICNRDYSKVMIYWESDSLQNFVKYIYDNHSQEDALKLANQYITHVNGILHKKEGLCRTYLIKKMDFKKVPRLQFNELNTNFGIKK